MRTYVHALVGGGGSFVTLARTTGHGPWTMDQLHGRQTNLCHGPPHRSLSTPTYPQNPHTYPQLGRQAGGVPPVMGRLAEEPWDLQEGAPNRKEGKSPSARLQHPETPRLSEIVGLLHLNCTPAYDTQQGGATKGRGGTVLLHRHIVRGFNASEDDGCVRVYPSRLK